MPPKQDNSTVRVQQLSIDGSIVGSGAIHLHAGSQIEIQGRFQLVRDLATGTPSTRDTEIGFSSGPLTKIGVGEFFDTTRMLSIVVHERANNREGLRVAAYAPTGFKVLKDSRTLEMSATMVVPKKRGRYSFQIHYLDELQSVTQPNGSINISSKKPSIPIFVSTIEVAE